MAAAALGVRDLAAVCGEPYSQWVIEDDFPAGRPAWERAGAVLTDDAAAVGTAQAAYPQRGALGDRLPRRGRRLRDDRRRAVRVPGLQAAMRRFIAEDIAATPRPAGRASTVVEYGEQVLHRFANPAIGHRTVQVAMDGSQKLPQRVLHTILDRRAAGGVPRWATLVVAAWMRFVQGSADDGRTLPLDDPLADDDPGPAGRGAVHRRRRGRRAARAGHRVRPGPGRRRDGPCAARASG